MFNVTETEPTQSVTSMIEGCFLGADSREGPGVHKHGTQPDRDRVDLTAEVDVGKEEALKGKG